MCGIAGILRLGRGRELAGQVGTAAMREALRHRGPDDEGSMRQGPVELGMRRLSIIGVSNGRQPIASEDGNATVVLNGEIYNYLELRRELTERGHHFATDSDAEVVVHLYEELGTACIDRLRGMFAFALWDRRLGRLLLARDRTGQKPLYWTIHDGHFLFASEIKALHASGLPPKQINEPALAAYLAYGYIPGRETLFRGVRRLPAGSLVTIDADDEGPEVAPRRYWDLPEPSTEDDEEQTLDGAAAHLTELLDEAVRIRLMSEVPLGAFLSGGVDSSAVVALMMRHRAAGEALHTFCVGFEDARINELPHARAVAEHLGTRHHELLLSGCSLPLLVAVNRANDEPAADPAAVPTLCLAHFARRQVTVALTGEGGDEAFAGYRHHRYAHDLSRLEARVPGLALGARLAGRAEPLYRRAPFRLRKALWLAGLPRAERTRGWLSSFTDPDLARMLRPRYRAALGAGLLLKGPFRALQERAGERDALAELLYVDSRAGLADQLLMKVDKMTMAASLEARCPLLDHHLLGWAARLPSRFKMSRDGSKLVLRRALAELVPPAILERPKQGFDVPLTAWLLGDLAGFAKRALLAPSAPLHRYLEPAAIAAIWRRLEGRGDRMVARQAWRLLNLALWHELHWPSGLLSEGDLAQADPEAFLGRAEPEVSAVGSRP